MATCYHDLDILVEHSTEPLSNRPYAPRYTKWWIECRKCHRRLTRGQIQTVFDKMAELPLGLDMTDEREGAK